MIVRGFISHRFLRTCLVTLINDNGEIINVFETTFKKAREVAGKFVKHPDKLEWTTSPWDDFNVQESKRLYEQNWMMAYEGFIR
jgi:hypothetical protein